MYVSIVKRLDRSNEKKSDRSKTSSGMNPATMGADEINHSLDTARLRFLLTCSDDLVPEKKRVEQVLLQNIQEENMVAYYLDMCESKLLVRDDALLASMRKVNEIKLQELHDREKNMKENHGEIEVLEVLLEIVKFYSLTGTIEETLKACDRALELKSCSTGQQIDVVLKKVLLGLVWLDEKLVTLSIEEAERLMEIGGDWDRRNRLKSYRAINSLIARDFEKAAEDFLSAVATFTTTELCSYSEFIFYAVITGIIVLDRVTFKKKVIDSPEVHAVVGEVPHLKEFLTALYDCDYKGFFVSLVNLNQQISTDRYLATHKDWFFREVRILAYVQFLESYKSVTMDSMATAFGVSKVFLDKELAHFISSGRINAKIDKVAEVIETCRPNNANARYQNVIKHGDVLLNRIQLLARSINV